VAFYIVYIAEAHPTDIWQMQSNIKERVLFQNPKTDEERATIASSCVRRLHITIPAVLDSIQNRVEAQYTAWPDRLYLVGVDGRIRFKSEPGPFGFNTKRLAAAVKATLDQVRSTSFERRASGTTAMQTRAFCLKILRTRSF